MGRSPDIWDAFCLTFAYPVSRNIINRGNRLQKIETKSPLKTLRRVNKVPERSGIGTTLSWG